MSEALCWDMTPGSSVGKWETEVRKGRMAMREVNLRVTTVGTWGSVVLGTGRGSVQPVPESSCPYAGRAAGHLPLAPRNHH